MIGHETVVVIFLAILGFIALPFLLCRAFNLPSPIIIMRLALKLVPPSKTFTCFDFTIVNKPRAPVPFREDFAEISVQTKWRNGQLVSIEEFLALTKTKAFLVIHEDCLILEKYFEGATKETLFPANSVTKAFVSALIGIAIDKKLLRIGDKIGKHLPAHTIDNECAQITIKELLNGRSRIDVPEEYSGLWGPIVKMYLTTNLNKFLGTRKRTPLSQKSRFEYRSIDAQLLGKLLTHVTGMSLSSLLEQELWAPLGAENPAFWSIDSERNGVEKAFSGLNATARDYAKFGSMYLHQGKWNDKQIVSEDWATQPANPGEFDVDRRMGYRNNWWAPFTNKDDGSYSTIGIHGQYIYVNPKNRTVIVKLSEHDIEEDLVETFTAFQLVAQAVNHRKQANPSSAFA